MEEVFSNLTGGIQKLVEKGDEDFPEHPFKAIHYPVKEINYRGKIILYHVFNQDDSKHSGVIAHGYKKSEVYRNEQGNLAVMLELFKKEEIEELRKVISKAINQDWPINFGL
jgi:hypothetical protein